MLGKYFPGRILPFDSAAAVAFAAQADARIAAIARSRGAALATRNLSDFDGAE